MDIQFSIVIPTRNGLKYLPSAIESVLKQNYSSFEIVISDNYSTDGTNEYLLSLNDKRIKRIQPPYPLSMINNFDYAINNASGQWITVIGDDDSLQPYFFELSNYLISQNKDVSVICSRRAYYFWKGCENVYKNSVMQYNAGKNFEIRYSKHQLYKLLFQNSSYLDEPQFYTGTIFEKNLISEIKIKQGGKLFSSLTLDANSASLLLKHTSKFVYSNIPLCWVGSSPKSNGFSASNDKETEAKAVNTIADFVSLNYADKVETNSRFKDLLILMDLHCFFLEAFIQSNKLYSNFYFWFLDSLIGRQFVFLKVYRNYLLVEKTNKVKIKLYKDLFASNSINLPFLKILHFCNRVFIKVKAKILKPSHTEKDEIILFSDNHDEYPTILDAGQAALKEYRKINIK